MSYYDLAPSYTSTAREELARRLSFVREALRTNILFVKATVINKLNRETIVLMGPLATGRTWSSKYSYANDIFTAHDVSIYLAVKKYVDYLANVVTFPIAINPTAMALAKHLYSGRGQLNPFIDVIHSVGQVTVSDMFDLLSITVSFGLMWSETAIVIRIMKDIHKYDYVSRAESLFWNQNRILLEDCYTHITKELSKSLTSCFNATVADLVSVGLAGPNAAMAIMVILLLEDNCHRDVIEASNQLLYERLREIGAIV